MKPKARPRRTQQRAQEIPAQIRNRKPIGYETVPTADPDAYIVIVDGNCLAPLLQHDDKVVLSPATKLLGGMIARIWPRKEGQRPTLKRLETVPPPGGFPPAHPEDEIAHGLVVSQQNPPRRFWLDAAHISAVHAAVGRIRGGSYQPLGDVR